MSETPKMSTPSIATIEDPFDALREDEGQDLAEYAILVGLIALAVVGAVTLFGGRMVTFYQTIVATLPF